MNLSPINNGLRLFLCLSIFLTIVISYHARADLISTNIKLKNPKPWLVGQKTLTGYKKDFFELSKVVAEKKFYLCKKPIVVPKSTPKRLHIWWSYLQLKCAFKNYTGAKADQSMQVAVQSYLQVLSRHQGGKEQLNKYLAGRLVSLSGEKNYVLSPNEIAFLSANESLLGKNDKAKYYNFLALKNIEKKSYEMAGQFYLQAYKLSNEDLYATRLKTLINNQPELLESFKDFNQGFEQKLQEKVSFAKFFSLYRRKKRVQAMRTGVGLLNKNKTVERKVISKMFKMLYQKNDGLPLNSRLEKAALECHAGCLRKLADRYFSKHKYKVSREFAKLSLKKEANLHAKMRMGFSSLQLGEYNLAKKYYQESINSSLENSAEYFEAIFRLGLIHFRQKNYGQVIKLFEGLSRHKEINDYNLRIAYWFWRALQAIDEAKATLVRDRLIKEYPLTYYGLKANQEKNGGQLKLPSNYSIFQQKMDWSTAQKVSWKNYKDFLEMMTFNLAQKELRVLFSLDKNNEIALYAHFSSKAANHYSAIRAMNIIWDKNPQDYYTKNTVKITLPTEFEPTINNYATKNKLEPALIQGLIKQESSFRLRAVSSSNAMGLMQLIPMTAADSAKYLRLSTKKLKSRVFEPELNIRLGTSYLNRLVKAFGGNIPFALAAYNAGIGNIRRWMKPRPADLQTLPEKLSSKTEDEIWIDELPWSETNFYVKAILRNLILYRYYYRQNQKIPEPSWAYSLSPSDKK